MKSLNLILRRTHLHLGMLLVPWLLVYGVSTWVFSHREFFREHTADKDAPPWRVMFEEKRDLTLAPDNADLRSIAQKILYDHQLKGRFGVSRNGERLNISVQNFWFPKRLTYYSKDGRLVAEEKTFVWHELLARLHFRTGYQNGGWLDVIWALVVDLVCLSILVWIGTGLYLWWKIPSTRRWGWVALGSGTLSFGLLLFFL